MVLRNWAGNVTYTATRIATPGTVDELQELVGGNPRVRAVGTRHCFNDIADTDGTLVSVRNLDVPFEVHDDGTASVPAGATYREVADVLHEHGRALRNLASLPHISVAGACATGTHGSGVANRGLACEVVGVEFVRGDGRLVRMSAADPAFAGSVLGLGAPGISVRLTLATVPAYELRQDVWLDAPLASVLERLDEVLAAGYSVSVFSSMTDPQRVDQIWIKSRADAEPVDGTRFGARPAGGPQHPLAGEDPAETTAQLGVPGPWHERLPHFRAEYAPAGGQQQQSEFFVDRTHGPDAIAAVHALRLGPVLQVAEFRAVAADDLWLSPTGGRDCLALHFTWRDDERVGPAVAAVERALAPYTPRPHWGKVFHLPPEQVRAHYPALDRFRAFVAEHDPERTFGNAFLERFVY